VAIRIGAHRRVHLLEHTALGIEEGRRSRARDIHIGEDDAEAVRECRVVLPATWKFTRMIRLPTAIRSWSG
jgi:hypothetical protein